MRLLGLVIAALLLLSACTTEPIFPPEATGPTTGSPTQTTNDVSQPVTGQAVAEQPSSDETSDEDTQDMDKQMHDDMDEDMSEDEHMDESMDEDVAADSEDMMDDSMDKDYATTVEVVEGDLVQLATEAVDPDGDEVDISFSSPIKQDGTWQTRVGDAGDYDVTVSASDGKDVTDILVLIRVLAANMAPSITGPDVIRVLEGETVDLGVFTIVDPDGDEVTTSYAGWMLSSTYRTTFDDEGRHSVRVIAQDTEGNEAQQEVIIVVDNKNRKPTISFADRTLEAVEGELVVIEATTEDADNDLVTLTFAEPFDEDGTWQTMEGDAGEYRIDVVASDGEEEVSRIVRVKVSPANRAPVITVDARVTVQEGDTIDLESLASVMDPEGDSVVVSYEGWLTEPVYETTFDDAGEYLVTIVASDGEKESRSTVTIAVENVNRAPVFTISA